MGAIVPGKLLGKAWSWSHATRLRTIALRKYNVRTTMRRE